MMDRPGRKCRPPARVAVPRPLRPVDVVGACTGPGPARCLGRPPPVPAVAGGRRRTRRAPATSEIRNSASRTEAYRQFFVRGVAGLRVGRGRGRPGTCNIIQRRGPYDRTSPSGDEPAYPPGSMGGVDTLILMGVNWNVGLSPAESRGVDRRGPAAESTYARPTEVSNSVPSSGSPVRWDPYRGNVLRFAIDNLFQACAPVGAGRVILG